MFIALINTSGFNWWWLLAIPATGVLLLGSYLLMARVEWLRNRKLTVCIALSVLAHALLLTGAYMARLFDIPDLAGDGSIRVSFEDPTDDTPFVPPISAATESLDVAVPDTPDSTEPTVDSANLEPAPDAIPEFETPEFQTPTFDASAADTPEDLDSFMATPDPFENSDPFETSDQIADQPAPEVEVPEFEAPNFETPKAETPDIQAPSFEALAEPTTKTAVAPPLFETPDFATADETLLTADADAIQSLEDRTPDVAAMKPAPTPEPTQNIADSHPVDPWTQRQVPDSSRTKHRQKTDLVPVRRQKPAATAIGNRYELRSAMDRMEQVRKRGGDANTEAAVAAAQKWLAANQGPDGRWDASRHQSGQDRAVDGYYRDGAGREADTGITGLAVLCFLANGNTHNEGEYRNNVAKALEFLMGQQSADGSLAGSSLHYARTYCHGIATLALSEAYAMTSDDRLRPFVQRAISHTQRTQQRVTGGWRYRPGQPGDTSQFGWQLMALVSADHAGIPLAPQDRHLLTSFLRTVSQGQFGGLASYRPGRGPSRSMTAEAMVCRVFLGQTSDRRRLDEAANYVALQPPSTGPMNLYYWYYATMAMYQYGGEHWENWNDGIKRRLLPSQRSSGHSAGSWDPNTVWGGYGGRVYSTAMAALCLEVYYRYLPLISGHRLATRP